MSMQYPGGGNPYALKSDVERVRQELREALNQNAGGIRRLLAEQFAKTDERLAQLASIANAIAVERASGSGLSGDAPAPRLHDRDQWRVGHGVVRVEDIPGRRIPYVLSMDLYVGRNQTSPVEQSVTISQEGPFIAVRRVMSFRSLYGFTYTDESGAVGRFTGRSYGRYRPTSSAWDLNDAQNNIIVTTPNPPVGIYPGAPGYTSSMAGYRSMELDALVEVIVQGASYPRQNYPVPSAMWSTNLNGPVDLGALDFFERGEQLTVKLTPTHPNNPEFGNASGLTIFGTAGWPFAKGQFDPHEGIVTPGGIAMADNTLSLAPSDPIERMPDGVVTVAWEGYKIIQPTGPVG